MSKSPFSKLQNATKPSPIFVAPTNAVPAVTSSPFSKAPKPPTASSVSVYTPSISKQDIENLGADIGRSVGETTEKIVKKVALSNFGDLGTILAQVQTEADKLDPNNQFQGVTGWLKSKFKDVKVLLKQQLESAQNVFDQLEEKIADHVAVQSEWIKDLDAIYHENFNQFKVINAQIAKAGEWKAILENQIANLPSIDPNDPEAMMKAEQVRELESLKNRLAIKIDNFTRFRVIAESNAPKIRSQIESSETTIMTLRDVAQQVIPVVQREFALYLQSVAVKGSQDLIKNSRQMANTALKNSADAAKSAAITSAQTLNDSAVDMSTLDHIRKSMIDTVTSVRQIELDAQKKRDTDAQTLQSSQQEYLKLMQKNNAI